MLPMAIRLTLAWAAVTSAAAASARRNSFFWNMKLLCALWAA
jgi:hypothetical protein